MKTKVLEILALCIELKDKGIHAFFNFSPHVTGGEVAVTVYTQGWGKDKEPDKSFMVSCNGKVRYREHSADEVITYLKGLL